MPTLFRTLGYEFSLPGKLVKREKIMAIKWAIALDCNTPPTASEVEWMKRLEIPVPRRLPPDDCECPDDADLYKRMEIALEKSGV